MAQHAEKYIYMYLTANKVNNKNIVMIILSIKRSMLFDKIFFKNTAIHLFFE